MADSPRGGLRGCPGDESAAAAAPSGYLVPPLHAGPVARCCQTARRLSWAPHRRGPKSSSPSAPPLPSSWLPPGLVQHHQTADSARERVEKESTSIPGALRQPGCCAATATSASPGPEVVAVPLPGRCSRSCHLAGGYRPASPTRLASSDSCSAPDLGRTTLPRRAGSERPLAQGSPPGPAASRARRAERPGVVISRARVTGLGGGEPGVSSANEGSPLAAGSQGPVGGLRGEDHCGEQLAIRRETAR